MVRSKDEFLTLLNDALGDENADSTIAILEDAADTLAAAEEGLEAQATITELRAQLEAQAAETESRLSELDESWKAKYRERFTESAPAEKEDASEEEQNITITIEDLFE